MKFVDSSSRVFTDFRPSCQLNYDLQEKYGLMDTHDYRYFLQQNSEKVKKDLGVDASGVESCKICPVCSASLAYHPKNGQLLGGGSQQQQIAPHDHKQQHVQVKPKEATNWDSYL